MYFLCAFCLPCCKLVFAKCAIVSIGAALSTPCEVNIAVLGKQTEEDVARAATGKKEETTSTQTLLYTPLITQFHEGQPKA